MEVLGGGVVSSIGTFNTAETGTLIVSGGSSITVGAPYNFYTHPGSIVVIDSGSTVSVNSFDGLGTAVTVRDPSTSLSVTGSGDPAFLLRSNGILSIESGASLSTLGCRIGENGFGELRITGAGTTWVNNTSLILGQLRNTSDNGRISVTFGANATSNGNLFVGTNGGGYGGFDAGGTGSVIVEGTDSILNVTGTVWLARSAADGTNQGSAILTVTNGGMLQANAIEMGANATINGSGYFFANVANRGSVAPGNSTDVLSITGNYTQYSQGRLLVELGGPQSGDGYDVLAASGTVTLAGTLDVTLGSV